MSQVDKIDPEVVAKLFTEHAEELTRFLTSVMGDIQLARDVVQVSFTKLVERGERTRAESRKAWLFRVAYNEALAIRRREAVGGKVARKLAWTLTEAESADEPLIRGEAIEAVQEAIGELPEAQRQIVRMRIYEEKTFATIAEELDIPLGTALGRMRLALAKLKDRLARWRDEPGAN